MAKSRGWMGPVVRNTPKRQQVRCPRKGKLPVTALSDDYYYVNCGLECQSVLMGLECHYGALYRPGVPQIRTPYHQRGVCVLHATKTVYYGELSIAIK